MTSILTHLRVGLTCTSMALAAGCGGAGPGRVTAPAITPALASTPGSAPAASGPVDPRSPDAVTVEEAPPIRPPIEPAPPPESAPPPGLSLADLGWPADTRTVEVVETVHVRRAPAAEAPPVGKIVKGTRARWRQVVEVDPATAGTGRDRCPRWIELEPQGWLCLDGVAPRAAEAAAVAQPVLTGRALVPGVYYDVRAGGTQAYATTAKIRDGVVKEELNTMVMVRSRGEVEVDGVSYQLTNKGYVPSGDLTPLSPSPWAGVDLRATKPPAWPFGFVFTGKRGVAIRLRAEPDRKARVVGSRPSRSMVTLGAERDGYVELEPGAWALRADVHRAALTAPPVGVGPDDRWIDVDLDEQVLIAYRGTTPEFATLVSSGRVAGTTPVGTYRVRSMAATTRMAAEAHEPGQYDVAEVPWAIRFRKGLFLHAAYWHDGFGTKRSHGCVNLAPRDARFLYEWAAVVPDGWSELELERGRGLVVRIRDTANPTPPSYEYADESTP